MQARVRHGSEVRQTATFRLFRFGATVGAALLAAGCSTEIMSDGDVARFVLVALAGQPPGTEMREWPSWCPAVLSGSIILEPWPPRREGKARLRHMIRAASGTGGMNDQLHEDTARYTTANDSLILTSPRGWRASFAIEEGGRRLRSNDAYCYPGQSGVVVDIPVILIYELEE